MKILIIAPNKDGVGGVEVFNSTLIAILKDNNFSVEFLTNDIVRGKIEISERSLAFKLLGYPYYMSQFYKKYINPKMYDLVICSGEYGYGITGANVLVYFHGSYKGYYQYTKKFRSRKENFYLLLNAYIQKKAALGKYVLTETSFIKNILEQDGINVYQSLANGIDCNLFHPFSDRIPDRKGYLFVGRYDYYGKGIDILEKLQGTYDIDLITTVQDENKRCYDLKLKNYEMPEYYNKYRIFVFPSRFEGFGLVTLEAMACGLPVVIFNVGIGQDIQNEIPEFVINIKNEDAEEFARRIALIETNYAYYSGRARETALKLASGEKFTINIVAIINQIINKNRLKI